MRLIDADALLQDVQEQIALTKTLFSDEEINLISKMLEDTFKRQIEKMPTIEAIPIEWIKEFIAKKGWARHYLTEEIINAWEAENGTDRETGGDQSN